MITDPGTEYGRVQLYWNAAELVCGQFEIPPSLILALGYRESFLGFAPGYSPHGSCGWGDNGNAWGLFQIDKRYHAHFVFSADAQVPEKQMFYACGLLTQNKACARRDLSDIGDDQISKIAISAYNCGYGNAVNAYKSTGDSDSETTGKDYAKWILSFKQRIDNNTLEGTPNV
jgi:Transglycosylase SLT domain